MAITVSDGPNLLAQRMGITQPGSPPVLLNHPVQSTVAIDGWKSVLFGLPFLLAGVGTVCAALNIVHGSKNAPDWLIGLIGGFFFSAGAFLIIHGLRGAARRAVYLREAAEHPGEPWLADHHWHRDGVAFSAFNAMLGRFLAALGWNAFLIPFFWVGLNVRGMGRVFLVFASLFALIGLVFWGRWLQMLGELLRYGNTFFAYDEFPYFLGQTLRAQLHAPDHVSAFDELTFTLRCVQEKYVTTGSGQNRTTRVVCFELYKDALSLSRDRLTGLAGGDISVEFKLPANQPSTVLATAPPTYWEVEAQGKARGGADFQAYFLVPVYNRS
ncbi:MAG TPA: hypothetical protein VGF61_07270 [Candidatus Acidoferrum sp.]|jgi:hypothetical protein